MSPRNDVLEVIKSPDYHSIVVDPSSDVSNKEQAMFCLRLVDDI